ncbi:MAG: SpoIID/LytB domain-containing protein [Actinomycetota bacterium]
MRTLMRLLIVALVLAVMAPGTAQAAPRVIIKGGGWGHGIGMSQYGTYGRAQRGDGAKQIIEHYYSGANVSERNMPKIRVGLLQSQSEIVLSGKPFRSGDGLIVFTLRDRKIVKGGQNATFRIVPSPTGGLRIYKNGDVVKRDGRRVFGSSKRHIQVHYQQHDSRVYVHDKSTAYAYGHLEIDTYQTNSCNPGFCARLVIKMPMQKYVYGLGEVPASWPQAALQTQAIAGRTYAFEKISRLGQHRYPCDCAVYDSVIDQAYIGDSKRTGSGSYWDDWKRAVNRTNDKVILHNGSPIQALYSSSSGGHTEHNENVWGGTPLPYLRGVPDGPDDNSANPNYKWRVGMSWRSFENKLQAAYNIGNLRRFRLIRPFGVSGRVTVVRGDEGGAKVVGSRRVARVDGWSLRSSLGLKDTLFRVTFRYERASTFDQKYSRLDGAPGDAVSDPYDVPKRADTALGAAQDFERGRMTRVSSSDIVTWQWGRILKRYDDLRRERGRLGMPSSDVHGAPGTRRAYYDNGALYQNPETRTVFALWGVIADGYVEAGETTSVCGFPTSDVVTTETGRTASFEHGVIEWVKGTGLSVDCA